MFIFVETVPFIASIVSWAAYDLSIFDYNRNDEVYMNKKQSDKQITGFLCTMYKIGKAQKTILLLEIVHLWMTIGLDSWWLGIAKS